MTSRTSPVGIVVIALAGLIAVGCSASTNAVFQALHDPAAGSVSLAAPDTAADAVDDGSTVTWWSHPDGYAMDLPPGWLGVVVDPDATDDLLQAVGAEMPEVAARMSAVLAAAPMRVSAIAADPAAAGVMPPMLIVLAQPTEGRRAREVKAYVRDQILRLPGLAGEPVAHTDVLLDTAEGVRFDYSIEDPDLGELRLRSYLIRFGRQMYLVNLAVSADAAADAETVFDDMANSLRFGV